MIYPKYNDYSAISLDKGRAKNLAQVVAKRLAEVLDATGATCVVVTGTSGLSMALAICYTTPYDFQFVYVRKRSEKSHGATLTTVGGDHTGGHSSYIFLDDLISSGDTFRRVASTLYAQSDAPASLECKGVVLYRAPGRGPVWDTISMQLTDDHDAPKTPVHRINLSDYGNDQWFSYDPSSV